jgi:hypothetical protein
MISLHPISALVVIALAVLYVAVYSQTLYREGFESFYYPKYCRDCNRRGRKGQQACMACQNCGWCVDPNGYGSCVLGDNRGPYFADCAQYYYSGGVGVVNQPFGPTPQPMYQYLIPWYGGAYAGGQRYSDATLRQLGRYANVEQYGRARVLRKWRKRGNKRFMVPPIH